MIRNAMIAGALNLKVSRPEAEASSASTVPATTTTTPRSASRRRQRFRTPRMTSTSSLRWSMPPLLVPTRLQEFLFAREAIRDDRLGRQQQHAKQEQIPPEALAALRFCLCHFLRGDCLGGRLARVSGNGRYELAGVDRCQIRFGGIQIDRDRLRLGRRGAR